ncbi:hypothetical protein QVD17_36861 [Tagetes erecta]|uniref:Uncharacterized protein n=1 Tax=Tagetes erecta TaxID=13708 RepID=A0AAD8NJB8_TARER|nr:hypothetical protein QVD17_36861 [Tagetes erecta]
MNQYRFLYSSQMPFFIILNCHFVMVVVNYYNIVRSVSNAGSIMNEHQLKMTRIWFDFAYDVCYILHDFTVNCQLGLETSGKSQLLFNQDLYFGMAWHGID